MLCTKCVHHVYNCVQALNECVHTSGPGIYTYSIREYITFNVRWGEEGRGHKVCVQKCTLCTIVHKIVHIRCTSTNKLRLTIFFYTYFPQENKQTIKLHVYSLPVFFVCTHVFFIFLMYNDANAICIASPFTYTYSQVFCTNPNYYVQK